MARVSHIAKPESMEIGSILLLWEEQWISMMINSLPHPVLKLEVTCLMAPGGKYSLSPTVKIINTWLFAIPTSLTLITCTGV